MTDYELATMFQQIHAELVQRIRRAEQDAISHVMFHLTKVQDDVSMLQDQVRQMSEHNSK